MKMKSKMIPITRMIIAVVLSLLLTSCSIAFPNIGRSLPIAGRLATSATDEWYVNYANVETTCGVKSITVAHLASYIEAKPLAIDDINDIAIYDKLETTLGEFPAYPVALTKPDIMASLTIAGQYLSQDVWFQARMVGVLMVSGGSFLGLDGVAYPGMSGSPIFNDKGELVGSMSGGHLSGFGYSGLSFITHTDLIRKMINQVCSSAELHPDTATLQEEHKLLHLVI